MVVLYGRAFAWQLLLPPIVCIPPPAFGPVMRPFSSPARLIAAVALALSITPSTSAHAQRGGRGGDAEVLPPAARRGDTTQAGRATGDSTGGRGEGAGPLAGLRLRSVGPALTSGRVGDIAVHPRDKKIWYVAAASGGVWKTTNAGTTWTPIFDNEGSYSIGTVVLDPKNPLTVWVGTGENNSQRSVSYGDGVYRSDDGGRTWKNVGLKASERIGRIAIDPRNSDTVYVAAQGPLWGPGGDRGLFKTADGGKTWKNILSISENTGVTDVVMDPNNPDTLYAASYQRRRHVWTF